MGFWTQLKTAAKDVGQVIGGALPVVGGIIQGKMNADTARYNTDKTNEMNWRLAQYQYSKDLEMWNRGNVYNSPEAQMQRLKAAGLNPNMIYGSGTAAGQAAGQLPKFNAPTMEYNYVPPVDLPSMISNYQDFAIRQAQTDNLRAQAKMNQLNYDVMSEPVESDVTGVGGTIHRIQQLHKAGRLGYDELRGKLDWHQRNQKDWLNLPKTQADYLRSQIARNEKSAALMQSQTDLTAQKVEYFMWQLLGGQVASVAKGLIGQVGGRLGRAASTMRGGAAKRAMSMTRKAGSRVDPSNKAWQKGAETYKQWMQRVNPNAK